MFSLLPKRRFQLNVVGKRWPEYYENCREISEELDLGDDVKFWEPMEQDKLSRFFKKMHIIVSNSRDEGNHTVIKEGMATGLYPIINSWKGAKVTYPENCIFRNAEEFKNIVLDWADNVKKEVESKSARQWVKSRYNAEVQAEKLVNEIEKLISFEDKVTMEVNKDVENVRKELHSDFKRSIKNT